MRTIEEKLKEHKQTLDMIKAPLDLEVRLRDALQNVPTNRRNRSKVKAWIASAAAALILIVGVYEYPVLAYYGSKLFNHINWTSTNFSEVAEQGYGQRVNESTTLPDGTVFTINGVVADDNGLIMYYTIDSPTELDLINNHPFSRFYVGHLKGFMTNSASKGGGGNAGKIKTQYLGMQRFEPVSPFSRTLTVTFNEWLGNGETASYPVSFKFDPNKAMKSIVKADISKSVSVDQGTVHYDSITASPTTTIVKGHHELEYEGDPRFFKTRLYVNGTKMEPKVGRARSPEFELEFDVLPTDKIETLELELVHFVAYHKVKEPISLAKPSDRSIKIGDEKLWIRSVTKTDTGYDVVIARKESTLLETDNLSVKAGGKVVPVSSISKKRPWDLKNNNIMWENTFSFNTMDKPEFLLLDGFQYVKTHNKRIPIPIEK